MKITADRFNDLKAQVKEECLRRAYSGSVSSYGGQDYDYQLIPNEGQKIKKEHYDKIATPLNAINSNIIDNSEIGNVKISDPDLVEMESFVTILKARRISDSEGSDCKSGCTGLCYGCQTSCTGSCSGCSGTCSGSCSGCGAGCSGSCYGGCSGGCGGCNGTCYSGGN